MRRPNLCYFNVRLEICLNKKMIILIIILKRLALLLLTIYAQLCVSKKKRRKIRHFLQEIKIKSFSILMYIRYVNV